MSRFGVGDFSPLRQAGFVGNPYRALSEPEWEEVAILPDALLNLLENDTSGHLQLLGEAGRGKSSILRATMREARHRQVNAVYEYIPNGADAFVTEIPERCWFCLDEGQRLRDAERARLVATIKERKVRVFLGSHDNLTPLFRTEGLSLTTVVIDEFDEAYYNAAIQNRLTYFAIPGAPHATLSMDSLIFLRQQFGSDLRQTERFLYDVFQRSIRSTAPISADQLSQELRWSP